MEALFACLDPLMTKRVADVGSGMGWLAYHMALRGYEVYAVDVSVDTILGLAAAEAYLGTGTYFERVQGELDHLPFLDASLDLVLYNASLQFAESLQDALSEARRVLRPGGHLGVLGSPVHKDPESASRAQTHFQTRLRCLGASDSVAKSYHHFIESELRAFMQQIVGPVVSCKFNPGFLFRAKRRIKGILLGMDLASFHILLAQKEG